MTAPPRTAEVLLKSAGALPGITEPLLGDLAEGFEMRVRRDGVGPARWWYYRETMRAIPHLLRDGVRSLRMADIRHLAGIVLTSYIFMVMLTVLATGLTMGVGDLVGYRQPIADTYSILMMVLAFSIGTMCTVLGGYLAAWLDTRAPLISALAVGLSGFALLLALAVIRGLHAPVWYWALSATLQFVGPAVGGVLRVRALR